MSDQDDQRRNGGESIGRREARSQHMRDLLAAQGITLDEGKRAEPARARAPQGSSEIDRDRIRAILLERGARPDEIDWMTASCPSEAAALAFVPTRIG